MMAINQDFLLGFVSGTVVGAVGYRLYEQNSGQLQRVLQPPALPGFQSAAKASQPSIEELVAQKERLEDLIAERKLG